VELDDTLAEGHAALAAVAFDAWDWDTTEREYKRALELFPNTEDACACWSLALSAFGRHDEAVAWAGNLVSRNPVSAALQVADALVLMHARKYDEAERHFKLAMELEPDGWAAPVALAELYKVTGRSEQAIPLVSGPAFANSSLLASAYAAAGAGARRWRSWNRCSAIPGHSTSSESRWSTSTWAIAIGAFSGSNGPSTSGSASSDG